MGSAPASLGGFCPKRAEGAVAVEWVPSISSAGWQTHIGDSSVAVDGPVPSGR
jgi:hypothetical protein